MAGGVQSDSEIGFRRAKTPHLARGLRPCGTPRRAFARFERASWKKSACEDIGMGRPRLAEGAIRENFTVRLTAAERARVEEQAQRLKLSPSDYARACLVRGTVRVVREEGHDPEQVRALLAIGNNLNQIARHLNASGAFSPAKLDEVLDAISALLTEAGRRHGPANDQAGA